MLKKNLLERIEAIDRPLSASHNKIISFVLSGHKAALLTASEIAASVGTSESTVVRLARTLGFHGYPELQRFLRANLLETLSPAERLSGHDHIDDDRQLISHIANKEILNIQTALDRVDPRALHALTEKIYTARTCYVMGLRSARSAATLLGHYLMKVVPQVKLILSSDFMLEELSWANNQDVLITYSFPRYSKPTVDAVRLAKASGAYTATITDTDVAPTAQLSDLAFIAPVASSFFGNSCAAAVAWTNLLLAFYARAKPDAVRDNLEKGESAASLANRFVDLSSARYKDSD